MSYSRTVTQNVSLAREFALAATAVYGLGLRQVLRICQMAAAFSAKV